MNVLVLGSGGREHALSHKIVQSTKCEKLFIAPGNPGTASLGENVAIAVDDFEAMKTLVLEKNISMVVVGPEDPLVKGIYDFFKADDSLKEVTVIGPSKRGALLEGSKEFSKKFMQKHDVPTAAYQSFTKDTLDQGCAFLETLNPPYVLKADGLAAGKGVLIIDDLQEAKSELKSMLADAKFGAASAKVVIEEFLDGEEASFIVMTDGTNVIPFASSQDHKALEDEDKGPNTGGMGAYSPAPIVDEHVHEKIMNEIIFPTLKGLRKDGYKYCGFLYAGMMIDKNKKLKVLEFNCRFGDPETQPIMMRLKSDLASLCDQACDDNLIDQPLEWDSRKAIGVVLAARGYPYGYAKGKDITNIPSEKDDLKIFHAGTKIESNSLKSNGGRVLCVTTLGDSVESAQNKAYDAISKIEWEDAFYRKDIGYRAIARERK